MTCSGTARTRSRIRLFSACTVLVGLALVQSPGLLVADTKFDLAVAPGDFLLRAAHLWDAEGALGQLQNQAYGYLWPMGPLFWLGSALDLPGWLVQRLWLGLVLVVALTGATRLARALGVRSDLACLLGGFAYALSPRMLTTLGPISIEALPSALAPWVLLPLVIGSERGSPRRAAALAALAVAMVGGVNAAATFAVLPLGAVWLLTRGRGSRRRTMLVWWPVFTAAGTLWWLVPLVVMGAYSPPFLDYIEAASNTTFPTTLFDALRGTSNWVAYVDPASRAGNDLLRASFLVVNSGVVLFLGLVGLMLPRNPHRLFLACGLGLGLAMVTVGHLGSVSGWAAEDLRVLLDGVLAPLRNVHKFDPVIRLPLVIGLAWTVDALLTRLHETASVPGWQGFVLRINPYVLVGAAVVAVAGAALPAANGRITPANGVTAVPVYWQQAADWLGGRDSTALLVPGSSFGDYVWGSPRDEPLQSLASSRWAVRNAVPLAPAGDIRMLDAIEARLAQGRGSSGLSAFLRRSGITHLVVRNDVARSPDVPDPVLVHQALNQTPGLTRVATFGPSLGGEAHLDGGRGGRILINDGWQNEYDALEVYQVQGTRSFAEAGTDLPVVVGGPEDLLDLADLGVLDEQPTELAANVAGTPGPERALVLTDGLRDVERHFGRVHDGASATRVPGELRRMGNRVRDYLLHADDRWSTTARLAGVASVSASSSMSDANAVAAVQRGQLPYAALDRDPQTSWRANAVVEQAWWQVDLDDPMALTQVRIMAGPDEREIVRVRTNLGVTEQLVLNPGAGRVVDLSNSEAEWLRVEDVSDRPGHRLSLAEVEVTGVAARRSLVLPRLPDEWGNPDVIVLRAVVDARTGCVEVDGAVRCSIGRAVASEEPAGFSRSFVLADDDDYALDLAVRPRVGEALDELLLAGQLAGVTASSTGLPDARASALAAIDGDEGTTWTAALADLRPTLRLNWVGVRRITGLDLSVAADTAARLPDELTVIWPEGRRSVTVAADGSVRFPAVRTDRLILQVEEAEPATSLDFGRTGRPVPVGIGELRLRGLPLYPVTLSEVRAELPCGTGPTIETAGRVRQTAVTASARDLYVGATLPARVCGSDEAALTAGENEVDLEASAAFAPESLVLRNGPLTISPTSAVADERAGPVRLVLRPEANQSFVSMAENTNRGWEAVQDQRLRPVIVDGWQQGWWLPGSASPVSVTYAPDGIYRVGLAGGLVCLVALTALCCRPGRRWSDHQAPRLREAVWPRTVFGAAAVLLGGLLAGWIGALVAAGGVLLAWVFARVAPDTAPWLLAVVILPAAAAYAVRPWGAQDGWAGGLAWPHYLVVAGSTFVVGTLLAGWGERPRSFRRRPGFSTNR